MVSLGKIKKKMDNMAKKGTLSKLKQMDREFRRTLITDAARELFTQKTYDKVSMEEIANTAGIAKSSIYTYFKSQEELYAHITYLDTSTFIDELKAAVEKSDENIIGNAIDYYLDYNIANKSQWRMITHFALHGTRNMESVDKLNVIGRQFMDLFETIFKKAGCITDTRLMAHTLFACLSGVLIAFRNYPGRSEQERVTHMKRIADQLSSILTTYIAAHKH